MIVTMMLTSPMLLLTISAVYYNSASDVNAVDAFPNLHAECNSKVNVSSSDTASSIYVSIIDDCIRNLKLGKVCCPDYLAKEHLLHARPSLIVHSKFLFGAISKHGFVPEGSGTIIPLLRDKSGNVNDIDNYRAIALVTVICILFEEVILQTSWNIPTQLFTAAVFMSQVPRFLLQIMSISLVLSLTPI